MSETVFEKWKHRFTSAWAVLTGNAFACYYADAFPEEPVTGDDVGGARE